MVFELQLCSGSVLAIDNLAKSLAVRRFLTETAGVFSAATVGQLCQALQRAAELQMHLDRDATGLIIGCRGMSLDVIRCRCSQIF